MSNRNILVKINGDASNFERATTRATSLSKQFAGAVGVAFGGAAVLGGLRALNGLMQESIKLATIQQDAEKKVADVIRATGGAAGYTANQLKAMASEMQAQTKYGDEAILDMQSILLTFKNISGDTFKSATAAAMDMATVMQTDLKSAAIQLGKALNDPVLGATAMSRAGIQFSESQKGMMKSMVATGDIIGAQNIILKELEGQMGGAAAGAADTFAGRMQQLANKAGDAKEQIGLAVLESDGFKAALAELNPAIDEFTRYIVDHKDDIGDFATSLIDAGIGAGRTAAEISESLTPAIKALNEAIGQIPGGWGTVIAMGAGAKAGGMAGAVIAGGAAASTSMVYGAAKDQAENNPSFLGLQSKVYSGSYGGASGAWGDPVVSAESVQPATTTPAPRTTTPSSKTADDSASKMQERIDKLRESLMTETELENKRYEEGLKLVSDYYGKTADLTTADDELKQQLAEDHAAKMSEISGVVKWEEDLQALQDKFKSEGELEDERYATQLEKLIEFKDAELVTKEEYMQMAEDAEAMHQKNLTDINAQAATDRSNKERAVQQSIQSMRYQTAQMGIELLSMFAGKSKAAAIAAIALSKGLMIAQTVQSTAAASMRALAELGPIAGPPAAASIQAMGAVQVGLIAATGLMQAASASSGGGSISTSSYGTSTTTSSDGTATTDTTTSNKTITIYGLNKDSLYSGEQVAELLNEYLADGGKLQIM